MTYQDIYNKFMIEYDKANVTSSYPSLTLYEAVTILDKAYLALIAQKLTGNNPRRTPFEADTKATEDLRPLVVTEGVTNTSTNGSADFIENSFSFNLPSLMLYYISAYALIKAGGVVKKRLPVIEIDHAVAYRFLLSSVNIPWIKNPVCYFENNIATMLYDKWELDNLEHSGSYSIIPMITYLKKPKSFLSAFGFSEEQGGQGGGDNPDIPDNPNDPQENWHLHYEYSNTYTEGDYEYLCTESNQSTITTLCYKGELDSPVRVSLISGFGYASLEGNPNDGYTITVSSETGDMFRSITIHYVCIENPNVYADSTLYVKYYQEQPQNNIKFIPHIDKAGIESENGVGYLFGIITTGLDSSKEYGIKIKIQNSSTIRTVGGYRNVNPNTTILWIGYYFNQDDTAVIFLLWEIQESVEIDPSDQSQSTSIVPIRMVAEERTLELNIQQYVNARRVAQEWDEDGYLTPELNEFVLDEDYIDYI